MNVRNTLVLVLAILSIPPSTQGAVPIHAASVDTFDVDTVSLGMWDVVGAEIPGPTVEVDNGALLLFVPSRTEALAAVSRPLTLGPGGGTVEITVTATSLFRFAVGLGSPKGAVSLQFSEWATAMLVPGTGARYLAPSVAGTPVTLRLTLLPDGAVTAGARDAAGSSLGTATAKAPFTSADVTNVQMVAWNHRWSRVVANSDDRVDTFTVLPALR